MFLLLLLLRPSLRQFKSVARSLRARLASGKNRKRGAVTHIRIRGGGGERRFRITGRGRRVRKGPPSSSLLRLVATCDSVSVESGTDGKINLLSAVATYQLLEVGLFFSKRGHLTIISSQNDGSGDLRCSVPVGNVKWRLRCGGEKDAVTASTEAATFCVLSGCGSEALGR